MRSSELESEFQGVERVADETAHEAGDCRCKCVSQRRRSFGTDFHDAI